MTANQQGEAMARAVACPNCRDELDIPDDLVTRPVKCASCGTVFTPIDADDAPTVSRAGRPRRRPSDFDARPRRRLLGVATLLLLGTFGLCCAGCIGIGVLAVRVDDPEFRDYADPAGRFTAIFPGPPQPVKTTLVDGTELTGVGSSQSFYGQPLDECSVRYYDLPREPKGDAARDSVLALAADRLVETHPGLKRKSLDKVTAGGLPAVDVFAQAAGGDDSLHGRVILAGRRVYFLTYEGKVLPQGSNRVREFFAGFRVLDPAEKGP
jgi:hypothetical protein